MNDRDKTDLWTALAIGAVVGVGAALLLRSGEQSETQRLLKSFGPLKKKARRAVRTARRSVGRGAEAVTDRGEELLHEAADALADLRHEAGRIVANARKELEDAARESVRGARRTARRARKRLA